MSIKVEIDINLLLTVVTSEPKDVSGTPVVGGKSIGLLVDMLVVGCETGAFDEEEIVGDAPDVAGGKDDIGSPVEDDVEVLVFA